MKEPRAHSSAWGVLVGRSHPRETLLQEEKEYRAYTVKGAHSSVDMAKGEPVRWLSR